MSNERPDSNDDVVDVEEFFAAGKPVPPNAKNYRIRLDKQHYVVPVSQMTGREILALAGKRTRPRRLFCSAVCAWGIPGPRVSST